MFETNLLTISTVDFKTGREVRITTRQLGKRDYVADGDGSCGRGSNKMHAVIRLIAILAKADYPIEVELEDWDNGQVRATQVGYPDGTFGVGVSDDAAIRKLLIRLFCRQNLIFVDGVVMEEFRDQRMQDKPVIRSAIYELASVR